MVLARLTATSTLCRDEALHLCTPTFNATPDSSLAGPHSIIFLAVAALAAYACLRSLLAASDSLHVVNAGFAATFIIPAGIIAATVYWTLDTLDGILPGAPASPEATSQTDPDATVHDAQSPLYLAKLWLAKLSFPSASVSALYVWASNPTCLSLRTISPVAAPSPTPSQPRQQEPQQARQLVLRGFGNPLGAPLLVLFSAAYMILAMFQKPMGGAALAVGFLLFASLMELHADLRDAAAESRRADSSTAPNDVSEAAAGPVPADNGRGLLLLCSAAVALAGRRLFFATGHQSTLASLQWEVSVVGLDKVSWSLSPIMVMLNTFAGPLMAVVAAPVLATWRRTLTTTTSTPAGVLPGGSSGPDAAAASSGALASDIVACVLLAQAAAALAATAATAAAALLRRHLMVWGVFAPKFIFAAAELAAADAAALLVVAPAVWLAWRSARDALDAVARATSGGAERSGDMDQ